ncbi:hypothetical protein BB561_004676 [Smittium simulii]|uniref:Uncharacterized protein n=1 Tax=Smittium simulii TaxID=133385 RepID=A0A2T9YEV2_9FUNG|nr:hypothetical protein BB561_004676 [Smittium simulii]
MVSKFLRKKQHPHWMKATIVGNTVDDKEINLHLPSAGKRKKHAILTLNRHVHKITDNKPHQKLIILVENPSGSRYNGLNMGRMLDHILYKSMGERPNYCTVLHTVDLSDHLPIQVKWGIDSIIKTKKISKISPKIIEKHANVLLNHNRFAVLADKNTDLDTLFNDTVATITDTATAMSRLREEFGISSINSICSRLRERAYFKWPKSKTWIADLIRHSYKSRSNTWVSGTLRWQKRYNHSIEQGATRISIDARNVRNDRSRISYWLITQKMQNSSNWISLQLLYPELRIGLQTIGKIRTGSYWTTERLAKSQLIAKLYREKCPCCNANFPGTIEHILIDCYRWAAIRVKPLSNSFQGCSESAMTTKMSRSHKLK